MTLPLIMSYRQVASANEVPAVLETYTHTCGFMRAWIDPYDPTLVWFVPTCPVEGIQAQVQGIITDFVTTAASVVSGLDVPSSDRHLRILRVIADIKSAVIEWLNDGNTTEEIAQFFQAENRLQSLIIDELYAQGVITPTLERACTPISAALGE